MNTLTNPVQSILLSFTGKYGTQKIADTWMFDGNTCITPYGKADLTIEFIKAKFLHFASVELTKSQNEKNAPRTVELWGKGFLSIKHEGKDDDIIIASDDTLSSEEYRTKNLELIEKELEKTITQLDHLELHGYISITEKDKISKKINKSLSDIFEERYGDIYAEKVKKELEFKDLIDVYTSYGLKDISFKKTLQENNEVINMTGIASTMDGSAIVAQTLQDGFKLVKQDVDFSTSTVKFVFEKTTSI